MGEGYLDVLLHVAGEMAFHSSADHHAHSGATLADGALLGLLKFGHTESIVQNQKHAGECHKSRVVRREIA